MPEYIELKSKAASIYDYRNVDISGFIPDFTPDPDKLERDLNRYRNRYGVKQECDEVQEGDLVVLSCRSAEAKFCKNSISVPVGKGMFSRELEAKLPGLKINEEKTFLVNETEVTVTVQKVTRTVLPELTDENVRAWGIEGVDTADDLKKLCVSRQISRFLDEDESADSASAYVWGEVGQNSTFELDPGEYEHARAYAKKKIQENQQPVQEPSEEAEDGRKPEDMEALFMDIFINELRMAVVGCQMCRESGTLLTTEDYEGYLKKWMEADPSISPADARAKYPLERFLVESYCDVIAQAIDAYVADCFQKRMNP